MANEKAFTADPVVNVLIQSGLAFQIVINASPLGIGIVSHRVIQWASQKLLDLLEYPLEEFIGLNVRAIYQNDTEYERMGERKNHRLAWNGVAEIETVWVSKTGRAIPVLVCSAPVDLTQPKENVVFTVLEISERKQAEQLLAVQRELNQAILQAQTLSQGLLLCLKSALELSHLESGAIYLFDRASQGLTLACSMGLPPGALKAIETIPPSSSYTQLALSKKPLFTSVSSIDDWQPGEIYLHTGLLPFDNGAEIGGCLSVLSAKKAAIARPAQLILEAIAGQIGRIVTELSAADELRAQEHLYHHVADSLQEGILISDAHHTVSFVNSLMETFLGVSRVSARGKPVLDVLPKEIKTVVQQAFTPRRRVSLPIEQEIFSPPDSWWLLKCSALNADDRQALGHVISLTDLSEVKRSEQALQRGNQRYQKVFNEMFNAFALHEAVLDEMGQPVDLRLLDINPAFEKLTGFSRPDILGKTLLEILPATEAQWIEALVRVARDGESLHTQNYHPELDKTLDTFVYAPQPGQVATLSIDISERQHQFIQQELLLSLSNALRGLASTQEMIATVVNFVYDAFNNPSILLALIEPDGQHYRIEVGLGAEKVIQLAGKIYPIREGFTGVAIRTQKPYLQNHSMQDAHRIDELGVYPECMLSLPLTAQSVTLGALTLGRDAPFRPSEVKALRAIAELSANALHRSALHEQTQRNLEFLRALRRIDMAISSNLRLEETLDILLRQLIEQLGIDVASIWLFGKDDNHLKLVASRESASALPAGAEAPLESFCASQVIKTRERLFIPDIALGPYPCQLHKECCSVHRSCVTAPLIAKGQVRGVLEINHGSLLKPTQEWFEFLDMLAGQAAIAVDNATLFSGLQQSNADLTKAYDTTLEGWARALDLRDHETEDHSRRVTEHTLRLARACGVPEAAMLALRRGALMHDIGKMAIPDAILLKPGPLTPEEWEVMRTHPLKAQEFLSKIDHFQDAIDIPLYHHEKWDGGGYPFGLSGERIPLAARIFAVVDVWDALTSDRSYRSAWSKAQTRAHMLELRGKHFDPQILDIFLNLPEFQADE